MKEDLAEKVDNLHLDDEPKDSEELNQEEDTLEELYQEFATMLNPLTFLLKL